ncbi:hypothetical protein [Peptoniphilus sp.]|jgi:hypothetical protein|uniref:hypothetical protein n=1 Tax=Peptoniphilus sp. TaxID=1971214 RepID=UPI003D8BAB0A
MTLLVTIFAAVISTIVWYNNPKRDELKLSMLVFMYWGASLMWGVDAVFEYIELGSEYFNPMPLDMLNDFFLGLSAVALGLVIWMVAVLVKDPKGVIRKKLVK